MKASRLSVLICLLVFAAGLAPVIAARAAPPARRVLILPLRINAPQDMTYLQQGILDMLGSRLAWEDKVIVLEKAVARQAFDRAQGKIDESTARALGRELEADFVLFGSLTALGQNVSLDAKMVDVHQVEPPVTVYAQSQGLDGVIPKVNEFAEEINRKVFGRQARVERPQPQAQEPVPAYRRHPDTLLTGIEGQSDVSPLNPNFLRSQAYGAGGGGFWRSPSFSVAVLGLDVGDLDGDGKNELVYISQHSVFVARVEGERFVRLAKFEGEMSDRFLNVDVADINQNGRAEIFVSNQNNYQARSYVLEFRGQRLEAIVKGAPWYFRVLDLPGGQRLVGQRSGTGERYYGGVRLMKYTKGSYEPGETLSLPKGVNIFNFTLASLTGGSKENLIVMDEDERLVIMSRSGRRLWAGKEYFGGTLNYMTVPSGVREDDLSLTVTAAPRRYYLPSRVLTVDLDGDGIQEIIVTRNKASSSRMFRRWRDFDSGSIYSYSFDQMTLRENWHSQQLPGCLADYQVKDYNNDGRDELIVAVILETSSALRDARSTIVAYDLTPPEKEESAAR